MRTIRYRLSLSVLLTLFCFASLGAQTDAGTVVVSAAKHETSLRSVSTTATVVTAEQIEQRGYRNVAQILRNELSIDIAQSGGPGGLSYPQVRGLPGKYLVVLIDGIRVNDPSDANGGVGTIFSHLTTGDIERIEVIRGAKSSLYGSNAATGVINIITRKGRGDGELKLSYEGGSLSSHRVDFGYSIEQAGWSLRADQNITGTDGVIDGEEYRNFTTSVKLGYDNGGTFEWETLVRHANTEQKYAELHENYFGPAWTFQIEDPNQQNNFDYTTIGTKVGHAIFDNWRQELNFGFSHRDRKTADPDDGQLGTMPAPYDGYTENYADYFDKGQPVPVFDEASYGTKAYEFTGTNIDVDYRHTATFSGPSADDILTAGFEYLYRDYDQSGDLGVLSQNVGNVAGYMHNQLLLLENALSINAGLRFDEHQQAGNSTNGSIGAAYDLRRIGLVLRANYGSAFRAPAVYELFASTLYTVGNPDLKPEKIKTLEFGFEKYSWEGKFRLLASTWHSNAEDAIVSVSIDPSIFLSSYENADKAVSDGVEMGVIAAPLPNWQFGFNYTYTDSRRFAVDNTSKRMVQVPYNKFNLNATWLYKGATVSVDGYWVDGSRLRWNLTDKIDSYFRLDLTARTPITKKIDLSLRVRNLLDEDYNESYGMKEAGLCVYGGLTFRY